MRWLVSQKAVNKERCILASRGSRLVVEGYMGWRCGISGVQLRGSKYTPGTT